MLINNKSVVIIFSVAVGISFIACTKSDFLTAVPSSRHRVITGLEDCQKLLDKEIVMNCTPTLGELSADDYYVQDNKWQTMLSTREKNAYVWAKDIFGTQENDDDWTLLYEQVMYANTVLDYLAEYDVKAAELALYNNLKGEALFKRAYAFYNLAQVFMLPYDAAVANTVNTGIPLRLHSDINTLSTRSSMQQTYSRIITDLKEARHLVPLSIDSALRNHTSLPAVMATLARVYLSIGDYVNALAYSDSCLKMHNVLLDYNSLDKNSFTPFNRLNAETIYQTNFHEGSDILLGIAYRVCVADSTLYRSYELNDLRCPLFFAVSSADKLPYVKGSYYGSFLRFSGLATDEQYLIRAECYARAGNTTAALADLNTLLEKRWQAGTFTPLSAPTAAEALQLILAERRKELVFRGLRWTDIRRLNKEGANYTLQRLLSGQLHTLPPNDKRYALPIPPDVIKKTGISQNPR